MGAVEFANLTFYAVSVHRVVKVAFGCTDQYLHALDVIGLEPDKPYGEHRDLSVSLAEEAVYKRTAAKTLLLAECVYSCCHKKDGFRTGA